MTKSSRILVTLLLSLIFFSCSTVEDPVPVESNYSSVLLRNGSISPITVNTDTILVNGTSTPNDIISLTATVSVKANTAGNSFTLQCTVVDGTRSTSFGSTVLSDNGNSPDGTANDSIYTGKVTFTFKRSSIGTLFAVISGSDGKNFSNTILLPFTVTRFNRAPKVETVTAPDTLVLSSITQILQLTAKVTDDDGAGDIKNVTLTSYRLPDTTTVRGTFSLYDDGGANGAAGNTDNLQGDGIYTLSIQLPPTTTKATYRFVFQGFDAAVASSNKVYKDVVIK